MSAKRTLIEKYAEWTKEALVERILALEQPACKHVKADSSKPISIHEYPRGQIALQIAYLGEGYHGFASQSSDHSSLSMNTVEDHLFAAIYRTRLSVPGEDLRYSRSGRTDAGVSGVGQVVSAYLRTSSQKLPATSPPIHDFCKILNRQLPRDIRVLAWAPVPDSFNARFECRWRQYKYFFPAVGLDLDRMARAAALLVGERDFRNFCRKDSSKVVTNYRRRVLEAAVEKVDDKMSALVIRGSAFLYNQVRCIMAVLFMVGKGVEDERVVDELLDVAVYPKRPLYDIADEHSLVLHRVGYDLAIEWHQSDQARADLFSLWTRHQSTSHILKLAFGMPCLPSRHVSLSKRQCENK